MATQQVIPIAFPPQVPATPEQPGKRVMQVRAAHNHTPGRSRALRPAHPQAGNEPLAVLLSAVLLSMRGEAEAL
jgi:hypothetical protein